jgi:hypothetical protein
MSGCGLVSALVFRGIRCWIGARRLGSRGPLTFFEVLPAQVPFRDSVEVLMGSVAIWGFAHIWWCQGVDLETSFALAVG